MFFYESGEEEQRGFYKKGEYHDLWVWVFKNGDKTFYGLEGGSFYMMEANEFIFAFSEKCGKSAIRCSGRVERYRSSDKDSSTITWDECSATKKE